MKLVKILQAGSIKVRLVLVYALVVCVALILLSFTVYNSVQSSLYTEVDHQLQLRANSVSDFFTSLHIDSSMLTPGDEQIFKNVFGGLKLSPTSSAVNLPAASGNSSVFQSHLSSGLIYVQIVNLDGEIASSAPDNLVAMQSSTNQQILLNLVKNNNNSFTTVYLDNGIHLRVLTLPLKVREQTIGYVQSARSLDEIDGLRSQILWPFIIGSAITALLVITLIWFITNRVFWPLQEITNTAYQIGVNRNLNQRLKIDARRTSDEVSLLGSAFNGMLDRLEDSFQMQQQFIADSSHELRTPLTVIRGNLDLLRRNPDPKNQAESLNAIEKETVRMQRLVRDLLLLAQADARQAFEMSPLQLDTIVLDVYMETKVLADAKHQTLRLPHFEAVTVDGDSDRLKRALVNLVENAIKYTPEEGQVNLSLFKGTRWARVLIEDNGIGIAEKDVPHIFDRFYRVDKARSRSGGGTGLGLAIVKHIIEGHGGRITVSSKIGKGSTFTVWLRLDPTAETITSDDEQEDSEQPTSSVEDTPQLTVNNQ